jgi:hypothetical protein
MIFERRIPRKIFGSLQERDGWRICTNHELHKLIDGANMVRFVTPKRLKWWGQVHRMEEYRMVRRILSGVQWERAQEDTQGLDDGMKS